MGCNLVAWDLALHAQDSTNSTSATPPPARAHQGGIDRVIQQLDLTDDQKPKVKAVLDSMQQQMRDLRADTSLSADDRRTKVQAIRSDANDKLKAILTPDQFEKWQKSMQHGPRHAPPAAGGPTSTNTPPQQ